LPKIAAAFIHGDMPGTDTRRGEENLERAFREREFGKREVGGGAFVERAFGERKVGE